MFVCFRFHSTDGRTALPDANAIFPNSACAPSSAFDSFPKDVPGVLALSDSSHALPEYLFYSYAKSFALCLPSGVFSSGVLFIGRGPYYLDSHSNVDVRSLLSYTPLLKNQDTFGYYIGVNTIVIKKRSINIPSNATTKISTTTPYTILRTNIYKQLVLRFSKVTKRLQQSKPIAPFGLCYKIITNGTQTRLKVPDIEFGLPDGKKWSVSTFNSMKQVTKDVTCLAFVDGGVTSEHAIMIGTFQMEDNFILFDLVNSTFGFSSSLLNKGTSCASFNFTGI
ncbi:gamma conglutin 1-like [Bidens hawaiensis]|uniref:gamma conglutin 1-like n=1 Tax=Bidens hawaiensis TaxID=980011 RepID=UPI00404A988F